MDEHAGGLPVQAIGAWYAGELASIEADNPMRGPLMLGGGIIYGGVFLGIFATYGLATLMSEENCGALRGSTIAFYTNDETFGPLNEALAKARHRGIHTVVRIVPEAVMRSDRKWERIAAAQHLQVQMAALSGAAFHVMMPDQIYNDCFFARLLELGKTHRNIVHNGLNAQSTCADDLEQHRKTDATIALSARELNDIAWKHMHNRMLVMNGFDLTADRWTNNHYQMWQARDRILMFGPHNSLSYISNETCHKLRKLTEGPDTPTGTMDVWVQRLCDTDFYVPQIDDEVSVIGFETGGNPGPRVPDCSLQEYCSWSWAQIRYHDPHLIYYEKPMAVLPTSIDESAPTVEEIMQLQRQVVDLFLSHKV